MTTVIAKLRRCFPKNQESLIAWENHMHHSYCQQAETNNNQYNRLLHPWDILVHWERFKEATNDQRRNWMTKRDTKKSLTKREASDEIVRCFLLYSGEYTILDIVSFDRYDSKRKSMLAGRRLSKWERKLARNILYLMHIDAVPSAPNRNNTEADYQ